MPHLEQSDINRMVRDHLIAYHYHDDATFEGIRVYVDAYNLRVEEFRNNINYRIRLEISNNIPTIHKYNSKVHQISDVYYFGNILSHILNEFWEYHGQLKIVQHNTDYELIREPGEFPSLSGTKIV
jgi:hypothetical protein